MPRYTDADALIEKIFPYNGVDTAAYSINAKAVHEAIKNAPTADVVEIPQSGMGDLSDGYHTFNELYHHRAILFSVICNLFPHKAWKSKLHDTGDMYDGMFIVGIETPRGQATYHYDINPYWDMFKVKELEKAPKWDWHTPQDAIDRISAIGADVADVQHGTWEMQKYPTTQCSVCGVDRNCETQVYWRYCPHCGAKMNAATREK